MGPVFWDYSVRIHDVTWCQLLVGWSNWYNRMLSDVLGVFFFFQISWIFACGLWLIWKTLPCIFFTRLSFFCKKKCMQIALMMYKTMNDLAPEYLLSLFSQHHSADNLRNSEGRLTLSKLSTNYLKQSFSYSGAMLWNNLPKSLKNAASVSAF